MDNPLAAFANTEVLVFDVDGVMTDGNVLVSEAGELLRSVSIRDGFALQLAVRRGLRVGVITGGSSDGVRLRLAGLGIADYYSGVRDKAQVLRAYLERHGLEPATCLYMGDDLPDLPAMRLVGLPCAPADAAPEVLAQAAYVSPLPGGAGCVRDVVERVLKLRSRWAGA